KIRVEHIQEILAVIIANYNATSHSELYGYSPLDFIRTYDEQNRWPPRLIAPEHRDPLALRVLRITVTVRGNAKQGKRPYVQFENAKYRSVVLSNNSGLIGKKLILHVYTEDLRSVRAFFEDHTELGLLKAQGVWG